MKIWFNKIHDSRRSMIEVHDPVIQIGRDPANTLVLQSPLVSKRHAVVTVAGGKLTLENVGINGCLVGETEVLGGESIEFQPGQVVRIWPYSLSFEAEAQTVITVAQMTAHLRSVLANLELKIHRKLLERLDLYELESRRVGGSDSILLLENHIEDICRELGLFEPENAPVLEEITGLTLHDYLVNQLILEGGRFASSAPAGLTQNEFDVPATLIAERETELQNLMRFTRERLGLDGESDLSARIARVESQFATVFPLVRPHLHQELRRYLILRTLKKDLKDTVFGFGPLQDLIRAPTISEIMVVKSDLIYVERDGVLELSGRRFISDKVTESIIERIVAQVGRRIDKSQPLVDARLPDGSRVNAIIPPLAIKGPCLTIRKFPVHRFTMDDLIEVRSLTPAAAMFLRACVLDHKNILVSGGTGTGKTTLLNVLSSFIPNRERIVTIEDTTELQLHQEHVVTLETNLHHPRPRPQRPADATRPHPRGRMPRGRGGGHAAGHEHRPRWLDDHRACQQCGRGCEAAGSAGADGGGPAGVVHSPPDRLGPQRDRPDHPPARRPAGRLPDRRGRRTRPRHPRTGDPRHLQSAGWPDAAGDRVSADLCRVTHCPQPAAAGVPVWARADPRDHGLRQLDPNVPGLGTRAGARTGEDRTPVGHGTQGVM